MTAAFTSTTLAHDKLLAGPVEDLLTRQITLVSGENRTRGAVLGRTVTAGTIQGAALAGNTGNGTIGSLTVGAAAREGVYKVVIVEPATNLGTFVVEDPDGVIIGRGVVGTGFTGAINFTVSDGGTDFIAGDTFLVTVSALTEKYKLAAAAATDGSAVPVAILAADTDASAADKSTVAYVLGRFTEAALTFGAGHTAATVRSALAARGIHLVTSMGA